MNSTSKLFGIFRAIGKKKSRIFKSNLKHINYSHSNLAELRILTRNPQISLIFEFLAKHDLNSKLLRYKRLIDVGDFPSQLDLFSLI